MTSFAVYQLLEHAVQMPDNEYKFHILPLEQIWKLLDKMVTVTANNTVPNHVTISPWTGVGSLSETKLVWGGSSALHCTSCATIKNLVIKWINHSLPG